jgi:hypothetical protein
MVTMFYVIPDTLLKVSLNTNKTGHHVLRYTWGHVHFFTSKDSKSIVKKHHKNIINRDITTKYYLYSLYFTLVS